MPIKIKVYNQKAEAVGEMKLTDKVFGVPASEPLLHQAVVAQTSNQRQVLAHTKDRSEVRGGGRKPWRQKGTGRARAGSSRSPIWIGGGITFGPLKERNFKKKINKKMKQKAMLMVLSDRVKSGNFLVLDKFDIGEYKTKILNKILAALEKFLSDNEGMENAKRESTKTAGSKNNKVREYKRSLLVINEGRDEKVKYSGRNLAGVEIINLDNINILDLLKYRNLILTTAAVKILEKKYK